MSGTFRFAPCGARDACLLAVTTLAACSPAVASDPGDSDRVSLPQAVEIALSRNFALLAAEDSRAAAAYREAAARGRFALQATPRASFDADGRGFGFDASKLFGSTGGRLGASLIFRSIESDVFASRASEVQFSLTQPLLRGLGPTFTRFALENTRRGVENQERSLYLFRQRLVVSVASAYYQVIRQRQLLEVADQSWCRSEELRVASQARVAVGLASQLDVLRAELQASQAESARVDSRASLETAVEQFRILLGLSPDGVHEPDEEVLVASDSAMPGPISDFVAQAEANRLELRELHDRIEDARRQSIVTRHDQKPQADLILAYRRIGFGTSFGDAWRVGDDRLTLSLSLSYPVQQSAARANEAIARLDLEARQRDLEQRRLEIDGEVRSAARDLARLDRNVEVRRRAVALAERQHRLATLRYDRGLASNFDVVDAEGNLFSARTALVNLAADIQTARLAFERVIGTLDPEAIVEATRPRERRP